MYQKKSRKRRPTPAEIEAVMAFYGVNEQKPRSMYDETFPRTARKPKITITQTIIEFS